MSEVQTTDPAGTTLSGDYSFDKAHTRFGFVARHAMVTMVHGSFGEFDGSLHLDFDDPTRSSVTVAIEGKSIDTGNPDRDAHLRSNDFFAMDEYPTISFASTRVDPLDEETYRVDGDLTIRGVTRPVAFDATMTGPVTDPWGKTRVGLSGSLKVNRKDWGMTWNMVLEQGGVVVSEKITLEFDVAATRD